MQPYQLHRRKHYTQNLWAHQVDGVNERIQISNAPEFSFGNSVTDSPFSLSCWTKGMVGVGSLMSKNDNPEYEWDIQYVTASGYIFFVLQSGGGAAVYIIRRATVVQGAGWNHVMCTYSGNSALSGMKIYFNGVRVDDTSLSAGAYVAMSDTGAVSALGYSSAAGYGEHKMAAPAIFNIEASLAQVGEVYAKKMGDLRTTSLSGNIVWAGYFPGGQTDYPTMTDYSGNGNNGSLQNMESTDIISDIPT